VRYSYKHDRISALAALTVSAVRKQMGVYFRFQQCNFTAVHVTDFLRDLLGHLRGNVVVVWDNGKIHKGPAMAQLRQDFPRLHIEWFPGYAPELNPVEQIWNDFKAHAANSVPSTKQDIRLSLHGNARRIRRSQGKLRSFVLASDLPTPPW
jgi:putative transposase